MRIDHLFNSITLHNNITPIADQCSQFIEESGGLPLIKNLPTAYSDVHRVKVRQRKRDSDMLPVFNTTFNDAFSVHNLRERSIFVNGKNAAITPPNRLDEPFYIFPIDGFRYIYNNKITNSRVDYVKLFSMIREEFGDDVGDEVVSDLLKISYTSTNLIRGIEQGVEIIIYNIPSFYAVRVRAVPSYSELLAAISSHTIHG